MFFEDERQIKVVIFDLDGTLIDAYQAVYESVNFTMKEMGFPRVEAIKIKKTVGWGDAHLIEKFVGKRNLSRALAIYRNHHKTALKEKIKVLPGAKRILDYLKKHKYKIAVASNRPTEFSQIILAHLGLKKYFDYVLCADKVKNPKPYPDILIKILKRLSLKPYEALYVGDMIIDLKTGQRARVKTVSVITGSNTLKELARWKPYRIIPNVFAVVNILKSLNV